MCVCVCVCVLSSHRSVEDVCGHESAGLDQPRHEDHVLRKVVRDFEILPPALPFGMIQTCLAIAIAVTCTSSTSTPLSRPLCLIRRAAIPRLQLRLLRIPRRIYCSPPPLALTTTSFSPNSPAPPLLLIVFSLTLLFSFLLPAFDWFCLDWCTLHSGIIVQLLWLPLDSLAPLLGSLGALDVR